MKEIIEIKRKEFEVIEPVGDRSFKVERKGNTYFLKKFEGDKKGFEETIKNQEILRNCGILVPKIYLWDKNSMIFVTDFIEGPTCFETLCKEDFDEALIENLFNVYYMCRRSDRVIDFDPAHFIYSDGKLYYLPFKVKEFDVGRDFLVKDLPYWFFTKDFVKLAHARKVEVDEKRLINEFEMNKKMTLLAIKYFR